MKHTLLLCLVFLIVSSLAAIERIPGEIIVRHHDSITRQGRQAFLSHYSENELQESMVLSKRFNIYLYTFNNRSINEEDFLFEIKRNDSVKIAQFNHKVTPRSFIPDDPRFDEQWALNNTGQNNGTVGADIKATYAWDLIYQYENRNNREIVVAVIDNIFALAHTDMNWWKNVHEIDGSNVDNDGNGYNGDYHGWNAYNDNANMGVPNASSDHQHGTHVAGIISAISNNGLGMAGITLGSKVMPIRGSSSSEAVVVKAYDYALENRILYNETYGEMGAFVVATNSSFGVGNYGANPANFPIWGEMYNLMGAAGILSAVAAPNANVNVDNVGDVPSGMSSPWLISVTNTNRNDRRESQAGYGVNSIHLGAPGSSILSAIPQNSSFASLGGTSMATPHVAGVIALMYEAASEDLLNYYRDTPDELALIFREYLLEGVDVLPALNNIMTGGRLNALNAVQSVLDLNSIMTPEPHIRNLFFSEFINGSDDNKALEIFNPFDYIIDLSGYSIKFALNGANWSQVRALNGFVNALGVFVISHPNADPEIINNSNLTDSQFINWNGNDVIGLFYNDELIDIIGSYETVTPQGWTVAGIENATIDNTLVRKANVYKGNINWTEQIGTNEDNSEWIIYPLDTFTYLGNHDFEPPPAVLTSTPILTPKEGIYTSPILVDIYCRTPESTIYYTLNGNDPDEYSFIYSEPFFISETTTVKAIAYANHYEPSFIAENFYHFPTSIENLAELRSKTPDTGEMFQLINEVIVSMLLPSQNKIYIQDETAGFVIYDEEHIITTAYNIRNAVIDLIGTISIVDGQRVFIPTINSGIINTTNAILNPLMVNFETLIQYPEIFKDRLIKVYGVEFQTTGLFADNTNYSINDGSAEFDFKTVFPNINIIGSMIPTVKVTLTGIAFDTYLSSRSLADMELFTYIPAPVSLSSSIISGNVKLSWSYPAFMDETSNNLRFNIYRDGTLLTNESILDNYFFDETTITGEEYSYEVIAIYGIYESLPISHTITMPVLNPVNDFIAESDGKNVFLNWTAPLINETTEHIGYNLYKSNDLLLNIDDIETLSFVDDDVAPGMTYLYQITAVYNLGESHPVTAETIVSEEDHNLEYLVTKLLGNYPNPFNPETNIMFTVSTTGNVSIDIYNIRGQKIRTLLNEEITKGYHNIIWNGTDDNGQNVSSGIYMYRLKTEEESLIGRMLLMK